MTTMTTRSSRKMMVVVVVVGRDDDDEKIGLLYLLLLLLSPTIDPANYYDYYYLWLRWWNPWWNPWLLLSLSSWNPCCCCCPTFLHQQPMSLLKGGDDTIVVHVEFVATFFDDFLYVGRFFFFLVFGFCSGGWGNSCYLINFATISLVVLLTIPYFLQKNTIRFNIYRSIC